MGPTHRSSGPPNGGSVVLLGWHWRAPFVGRLPQTLGFLKSTMDSVIVFFANASFEDVELEASAFGFVNGSVSRGEENFYLWRYPEEAMRAELEVEELEVLCGVLGCEVKSAFQVACRHGANARFALQVVSLLMSKFKPSVLDDDFGGLWRSDQVANCAGSNPDAGLYALRPNS